VAIERTQQSHSLNRSGLPAHFTIAQGRSAHALLPRRDRVREVSGRISDDHRCIRPHAISESFFTSVLVRELRRSDRSNLLTGVALVALRHGAQASPIAWRPVIDALNAAKRQTDVIGWFKQGSAVGVIFPEISPSEAVIVRDLEARMRSELAKRIGREALDRLEVRFHVSPCSLGKALTDLPIEPMPIDLRSRPQRASAYDVVKRGLDIVGSALLLVALAPVLIAIAAIVKLTSRGPVLFRQTRIGQMGKSFTMLKFRTMRENADHALHRKFVSELINSAPKMASSSGEPLFKLAKDPRVTPLGRILRKTSLDELPQLWNTLIGDMSLVGPRPPIPYEVEQYKFWHNRRFLEAKPGVTGLWQVAGRSRTTFDEMVRLDLRYAKSCSLWTDLKILVATPAAVFTGKGAR
jgi:lipopolysaccharide/colanic/teichoic acid biosynthesis glycosyltransferase